MTLTTTRTFDAPAGRITGVVDGDVVRALGIPYAEADRFRPPRPLPPFAGEYRADTRSPASPQRPSPLVELLLQGTTEGLVVDERCQALSITVPADAAPDERLPVMVWIHGGSYVIGAGDAAIHDPRALVAEQRVVVVTVTYRLGVLGFLGDGETVPANLGLLDLVAALRWTAANIAAFGGDPSCVTLFGQSAGGDAIAHLMISDGAAGLFRRAIVQSAPLGLARGRARMARAMVRAAGALSEDGPVEELLEREARAERVASRHGLRSTMPFGTQYGFPPLPAERDRDAAWRRVAPDVDLLIGSASDETAMYVPVVPGVRRMVRVPVLRSFVRWLLVRPLTERIYGRDARRFARRHRAAGGSAVVYRLLRAPSARRVGAVHMSEVPMLLGSREAWAGTRFVGAQDWPEVERRGRRLRAIWAGFARTGRIDAPDDDGITFDRC